MPSDNYSFKRERERWDEIAKIVCPSVILFQGWTWPFFNMEGPLTLER